MRTGFTLVELLLALAIFAIVALVISSAFGIGINAWRKMDIFLERYQEVRLLLGRISQELRNCVDMDMENFNLPDVLKYDFWGEENKIIFFSVRGDRIKRIIYEEKEDSEAKEDKCGTKLFLLQRREEDFTTNFPDEDRPAEQALDLVKDVEFRFLGLDKVTQKPQWFDNWTDAEDFKKIPLQIHLRFVFYIPTGKKNVCQDVTLDKYVDIPSVPKK